MLASISEKTPALQAYPTHTTEADSPQLLTEKQKDLSNDIEEHFIKNPEKLIEVEATKKRKSYKKRKWRGHRYGVDLIIHTAFLFQAYHFAYVVTGAKINPSKKRLAREVGVCIRTLDVALKVLKEMGVISWVSGKKTWEPNTYFLAEEYKTHPMRKPEGFRHPKHLWLKIQWHIQKNKCKELTRRLYEHILKNIADHMFHINKFIRSSLEKKCNNSLRANKDPPKTRKKPNNWRLLKPLDLNFKDQWILGRYSEFALRSAIDDLKAYQAWGKEVKNIPAFITNRCKAHKAKLENQWLKTCPEKLEDWLMSYFKTHSKKIVFISKQSDLDLATNERRPFVQFLKHKEGFKKSVLKVWQKVRGQWIDKVFEFNRPNLADAIEFHLESSIKQLKY